MSNKIKKCPHCGHVIEHFYNHKCPYCRQMLYVTDDTIKEFNNCDLKIKDVILERSHLRADYIIIIYAYSYPKVQWFEEETEYGFITSSNDVGKLVGYSMSVPMELLYNHNLNEFIDFIERSIPPIFERNKFEIIDKILDCVEVRRFR